MRLHREGAEGQPVSKHRVNNSGEVFSSSMIAILQRQAGNAAVQRLIAGSIHQSSSSEGPTIQREIRHGKGHDFKAVKERVVSAGVDVETVLSTSPRIWNGGRPTFYDEIIKRVKAQAEWREVLDPWAEVKERVAQCQSCKKMVTYQGSSIDHSYSSGWEAYLSDLASA